MPPYRVGLRVGRGVPGTGPLGLWRGPNGIAMLAAPQRGPGLHAPDPSNPE